MRCFSFDYLCLYHCVHSVTVFQSSSINQISFIDKLLKASETLNVVHFLTTVANLYLVSMQNNFQMRIHSLIRWLIGYEKQVLNDDWYTFSWYRQHIHFFLIFLLLHIFNQKKKYLSISSVNVYKRILSCFIFILHKRITFVI